MEQTEIRVQDDTDEVQKESLKGAERNFDIAQVHGFVKLEKSIA